MNKEEIIKYFEKNMCVSFDKFIENWKETNEWLEFYKKENEQLKERIDTAIRYIDCEGYDVYFKDEDKAKTLLQILKDEYE